MQNITFRDLGNWWKAQLPWLIHCVGPVATTCVVVPGHVLLCHWKVFLVKGSTVEHVYWGCAVMTFISCLAVNQVDPGTVYGDVGSPEHLEELRHGEKRGEETWC